MEEIEKPHLIYALPRTRSTVILQASLKEKNLDEPFNMYKIHQRYRLTQMTDEYWNSIVQKINNNNVVSKLLSSNINHSEHSKNWWNEEVRETNNFKIFVVYRDLEEICWSHTFATQYGWYKHHEPKELKPVTIDQNVYFGMRKHIDSFIEHFPKYAELISWDRLPKKYFDKNRVQLQEQFSKNKISNITNIDYCIEETKDIIKKYEPLLEEKYSTLKWAE